MFKLTRVVQEIKFSQLKIEHMFYAWLNFTVYHLKYLVLPILNNWLTYIPLKITFQHISRVACFPRLEAMYFGNLPMPEAARHNSGYPPRHEKSGSNLDIPHLGNEHINSSLFIYFKY